MSVLIIGCLASFSDETTEGQIQKSVQ